MSGARRAEARAALSRPRIGAGVRAGASMATCSTTSKPAKPNSWKVGTSGASGLRSRVVAAGARRSPDRMKGMTAAGMNSMPASPASTAWIAGPPPRDPTSVTSICADRRNISVAKWDVAPTPAFAYSSRLFEHFASATYSATGALRGISMKSGLETSRPTPTKARSAP